MIASATAHHASPRFGGIQVSHLVVCAAELEAENRLLVLALEQDIAFQPVAQVDGLDQGNLTAHLSNTRVRRDDETKILRILA